MENEPLQELIGVAGFGIFLAVCLVIALYFAWRIRKAPKPRNHSAEYRRIERNALVGIILIGVISCLGIAYELLTAEPVKMDRRTGLPFPMRHRAQPEDFLFVIVSVILVGGSVYLTWRWNRSSDHSAVTRFEERLRAAAAACSGDITQSDGLPVLSCRIDGRSVRYWYQEVGDPENYMYVEHHTAVSANFPCTIRVLSEGGIERLAIASGIVQEVVTGDISFDNAFLVRSDNSDVARTLLSNGALRSAITDWMSNPKCVREIGFYPEELHLESGPDDLRNTNMNDILKEITDAVGLAQIASEITARRT